MEIWKDIPGYEGKYQASSLGRIRSLDRQIGTPGTVGCKFMKGRVLRPGPTKSGHLYGVLGHGAAGTPVHQLIDPTNNRADNLRYDTRTNNILDVFKNGKHWRKLSLKDVREILNEPLTVTGASLAKKYGVSQTTISRVRLRRYKCTTLI